MTNQEAFLIGRALGLAESGGWNDTLDALTVCPRPLFERVEAYIAKPDHIQCGLRMPVQSYAAEQGLGVPQSDYDICGQFGKSPWTEHNM